ncbi:hypothetical protein vBPMCPL1_0045 [Proteus phage vB_PMC-PL1]
MLEWLRKLEDRLLGDLYLWVGKYWARDSFAWDLQRFADIYMCGKLFVGIVGILGEFYRLLQDLTFLVVGMFVGTTVDRYLG